jgi:hypothetical protein
LRALTAPKRASRATIRKEATAHEPEIGRGEAKQNKLGQQIDALKVVTYKRILVLSKENEFWRNFLVKILDQTMKGDTNAKKIVAMFFRGQGLEVDEDIIRELNDVDIAVLVQQRKISPS